MPFRQSHRPGRTPATHPRSTFASGLAALAVACLFGFVALGIPGEVAAQEGIALGATPESVVLETLHGEPVDLGELVGEKPILLEFWATWCAVCRALEPEMQAAHEAYGDRVEFVIVAAAVAQTRQQVQQYLARHPAPGRVLWDTRGRFTRTYDAPGTGWIVILDADGKVAYTGAGPDQDLVGALERVLSER